MTLQFKTLLELDALQVLTMLKLRQDVFCIEQRCLYPDIDNTDHEAIHCLAFQDETLIGYARIYHSSEQKLHIGRIVVKKSNRGDKIGKKLVQSCIDYCSDLDKNKTIEISAQMHLSPYYQDLGFKESSASYFEDGIPHITMLHNRVNK